MNKLDQKKLKLPDAIHLATAIRGPLWLFSYLLTKESDHR